MVDMGMGVLQCMCTLTLMSVGILQCMCTLTLASAHLLLLHGGPNTLCTFLQAAQPWASTTQQGFPFPARLDVVRGIIERHLPSVYCTACKKLHCGPTKLPVAAQNRGAYQRASSSSSSGGDDKVECKLQHSCSYAGSSAR
eukprot:1161694-Pelagomonas_calceolata.AAC.5